jgi:hypothetical protein
MRQGVSCYYRGRISDTAYPDRPIPGAAATVLPFVLSFAPVIYDTVELERRLGVIERSKFATVTGRLL